MLEVFFATRIYLVKKYICSQYCQSLGIGNTALGASSPATPHVHIPDSKSYLFLFFLFPNLATGQSRINEDR
jgi:hypothetical protein